MTGWTSPQWAALVAQLQYERSEIELAKLQAEVAQPRIRRPFTASTALGAGVLRRWLVGLR